MIIVYFQSMDLTPEMRMQIYKHMGHTPSIHHNIYQQVVGGLEMVNMGKLLIIHEKNLMSRFKGKSLNSVQLEGKIFPQYFFIHQFCL